MSSYLEPGRYRRPSLRDRIEWYAVCVLIVGGCVAAWALIFWATFALFTLLP